MSATPDLERTVGDWLRADASADGSDRVLAASLTRIATAGQVVETATWRWRSRWRPGATGMAAAALLALAAVSVALLPTLIGELQAPVIGTPTASPTAAPSGRTASTIGGLPFSFAADGSWERKGRTSLNRSIAGLQGAEAMILWARFPVGDVATPCGALLTLPDEASPADLASVIAAAPGTELVAGPTDATVGGRQATHVVVTIREDRGCDPGYFFSWSPPTGGAFWRSAGVGDTIRIWIADVAGARMVIEGLTHERAVPWVPMTEVQRTLLEQQIQEIVDSVRFE